VHPNDHVNRGQSSNDVIPTALHLGALLAIQEVLEPACEELRAALAAKSEETWGVIKTGRTHLQDATPIRMGQAFLGYAGQMELARERLAHAKRELSRVPLGGTAVGTGVNTHPEFARRVLAKVARAAGVQVEETTRHFQAQATIDAVVEASGSIRTVAVSLIKIANDVRLMGSGPRCGIGELALPEVQPGSSIMPGKVNPVIPEVVTQVSAQVIGNDTAITVGGMQGHLELNVFVPLMARNLLESIRLLGAASRLLAEKCVDGIEANRENAERYAELTLSAATALNPYIGYDKAAEIVKTAAATGRSLREVAREAGVDEATLDKALDYRAMTKPHQA
jgi:fumarate hydratase class II